jgi:hypothetical protein
MWQAPLLSFLWLPVRYWNDDGTNQNTLHVTCRNQRSKPRGHLTYDVLHNSGRLLTFSVRDAAQLPR